LVENKANTPPLERAKRYRALAKETLGFANEAKDPDVKHAYLVLAEQWSRLADDTEADGLHL
jgi:hypothetical protein